MSKIQEGPSLIDEIRADFLNHEQEGNTPDSSGLDVVALQNELSAKIVELRADAGNKAIAEFVDDLTNQLFKGELTIEQVRALVRRIEILEFLSSTERKKRYIDYKEPQEIKTKLTDSIRNNLLYDCDQSGEKTQVEFVEFKNRLEHVFFRFVLTAHPVYPFTEDLMILQSQLITGSNENGTLLNDKQKKDILLKLLEASFKPEENLTINREFDISMKALQNMRKVLFDFRKIVLEVAYEAFPEQWTEINVQLLQLASWVCYDTDGRNDINQFQSFLAAYRAKYDELLFLKESLENLPEEKDERLQEKIAILKLKIQAEINLIHEEIGLLDSGVKKNLENQSILTPLQEELQRLYKEKERMDQRYFSTEGKRKSAISSIDRKINAKVKEISSLEEEGVIQIEKFEQRVSRKQEERILNADGIIQILNNIIDYCTALEKKERIELDSESNSQERSTIESLKIELVALRSEISNGLSNALIHMRTGALRFENAASLLLTNKNIPIFRQGHSEALGKQTYSTDQNAQIMTDLITRLDQYKAILLKKGQMTLEDAKKMQEEISFAKLDVDLKKIDSHEVTVIKFFATIVEMYRYIDSKTPIRFLISEFEHDFSYLTALFFAKFFELEEKIEICPLIEFKKIVQEDGIGIINRLLSNPHVQDYVRQQGRFYLQLGFSDGGRQTTQFGFSDAAESLRLQVKELLNKNGLAEIDFVCFPTGGESSARGRNLFSFKNTLEHFSAPMTRCTISGERDFQNTIEQTLQGMDGQFWALLLENTNNILYQALNFAIQSPQLCDPYYNEDYADFLNAWHGKVSTTCYQLLKEKGHALILDLFEFIDPDEKRGSRPVVRERDRHTSDEKSMDAEKKRAINYSATFDNLNYKMQVLAGVGTFLSSMNSQQRKQFNELYQNSQRFKLEVDNILRAYSMVDVNIFAEYLNSKMPETYSASAQIASSIEMRGKFEHAANKIRKYSNERNLKEVQMSFQNMKNDLQGGEYFLNKLLAENEELSIQPEHKSNLTLLHCLRIAVNREIMRRSAELPRFNQKGVYSYEATMRLFYEGNIAEAVSIFKIAFPVRVNKNTQAKGIQIMENRPVDYTYYHENIFNPLLRLNDLFTKITSAVSLCEDGWG